MRLAHVTYDHAEGLLGVRQRQQLVGVLAVDVTPAQMIGDPRRLDLVGERPQPSQVRIRGGVDRADAERDAVQRDVDLRADVAQDGPGSAAIAEEVLGDGLHPVHADAVLEHVTVVTQAQADAVPEIGALADPTRITFGTVHTRKAQRAGRGRGYVTSPPTEDFARSPPV